MEQKSFLFKNEQEVNIITTRILLWTTLVFPLIFLLNSIGIFGIDPGKLSILTVIGILSTFSPFILLKLKMNSTFIKYFAVLMSTVVIGLVAANPKIGIYLLYLFPIALSCLYFDRKLTTTAFVLGICNLLVSRYFRIAQEVGSYRFDVVSKSYIPLMAGYLLEFLLLSLLFMLHAQRIKSLFSSLMDSEKQSQLLQHLKLLMNKSSDASHSLANSVTQLSATMEQTVKENEEVSHKAGKAAHGCEENLKYIESASASVEGIYSLLKNISVRTATMSQVSSETYKSAEESEKNLAEVVGQMEEIETAAAHSMKIINQLGERSRQVGKIIEIITAITSQTNMLALNAAIESARAGEQGKGFAVVANEIKKLADESANAAKEIAALVKHIQDDTLEAVQTMDQSTQMIQSGMDKVRVSGKTFHSLKQLQEQSNSMIQEIAASSSETSHMGQNIMKMVTDIKAMTTQSLSEVDSMAAYTQHQSAAMEEIAASFEVIDDIASDLLNLSKNSEVTV